MDRVFYFSSVSESRKNDSFMLYFISRALFIFCPIRNSEVIDVFLFSIFVVFVLFFVFVFLQICHFAVHRPSNASTAFFSYIFSF